MSDKSEAALKQDNCADGCHVYRIDWQGRPRCSCGKVMDEYLREDER